MAYGESYGERTARMAAESRTATANRNAKIAPFSKGKYNFFTPSGQPVKMSGKVPMFGKPGFGVMSVSNLPRSDFNSGRRFMYGADTPGAYQYKGPGYSGVILDYDPQGKEFSVGGRTYNARKSSTGLGGGGGSADYLKNLPKAPVYDNAVGALKLPELSLPKADEGRMSYLSQKIAAPGLRAARGQMQRLGAQKYSTPQERAKVMREAFGGLGQAYEDIISGSRQAGKQEYMDLEFNPQLQKIYKEYESDVSKQTLLHQEEEASKLKKFEAAWNTWKTQIDIMSRSEEAGLARQYDWQKTQYTTEADRLNDILHI